METLCCSASTSSAILAAILSTGGVSALGAQQASPAGVEPAIAIEALRYARTTFFEPLRDVPADSVLVRTTAFLRPGTPPARSGAIIADAATRIRAKVVADQDTPCDADAATPSAVVRRAECLLSRGRFLLDADTVWFEGDTARVNVHIFFWGLYGFDGKQQFDKAGRVSVCVSVVFEKKMWQARTTCGITVVN
ncbi:MAG: hypothetical protein HOP28_17505 [Gemmatimonadales bacterium]|nr:hypothetical protein [Gemmatimonadales bacterium]